MKQQSEEEILARLAACVTMWRKRRGFTQKTLAEKAGLPRGYVGDIEGARRNPSLRTLLRVANALGVPIAELFSDGAN